MLFSYICVMNLVRNITDHSCNADHDYINITYTIFQTSIVAMVRGKQLKGKKALPTPQPVNKTEADTDSDDSVSSGFLTRTNIEESQSKTNDANADQQSKVPPFLSRDPKSASRESSSDSEADEPADRP